MISQERLKELLAYNPDTGEFTRLISTGPRARAGSVAGSFTDDGYIAIKVDTERHRSHRLAWLYVYGIFPELQIDHINGVKNDNRIVNLREASVRENQRNKPKQKNNKTGFRGVCFCNTNKKYVAQIRTETGRKSLGYYQTVEAAAQAYEEAAKMYFGEFHWTEIK